MSTRAYTPVSSEKTERSAVRHVQARLDRIPKVGYAGQSNDKTISYDGFITLYSSKDGSKEGGVNNIGVQIKGRHHKKLHGKSLKFGIDRNDLETFKVCGGCIFFVDEIKSDDEFRLFYRSITPSAADLLLKDLGNRKTCRVKFERVPEDDDELYRRLRYFSGQKNTPSKNLPDPRILKQGEITLHSAVTLDFEDLNSPVVVDFREGHQSLTVKTYGIDIPYEARLLLLMPIKPGNEILPWNVSAGGKKYYDHVSRTLTQDQGCVDIGIGDSVTMRVKRSRDGNFSQEPTTYKPCHNLQQAKTDLEFLNEAINSRVVKMGPASFHVTDSDNLRGTVDQNLDFVNKTIAVLDALGISSAGFDVYTIADQSTLISLLYQALVEKQEVRLRKDAKRSNWFYGRLGDYSLLLLGDSKSRDGNLASLIDPFRMDAPVIMRKYDDRLKTKANPEGALDVPVQLQLAPSQLAKYSNLHWTTFNEAMQRSLDRNCKERCGNVYKVYADDMHNFALSLILAADLLAAKQKHQVNDQRRWESLLDVAAEIFGEYKDAYDTDLLQLNQWQIKVRKGTLINDDKQQIADISKRKRAEGMKRMALDLVKGATNDARCQYEKLNKQQQKNVTFQPIYHLFNRETYVEPFKGTALLKDGLTAEQAEGIINMSNMSAEDISNTKKFSHPAPGLYIPKVSE